MHRRCLQNMEVSILHWKSVSSMEVSILHGSKYPPLLPACSWPGSDVRERAWSCIVMNEVMNEWMNALYYTKSTSSCQAPPPSLITTPADSVWVANAVSSPTIAHASIDALIDWMLWVQSIFICYSQLLLTEYAIALMEICCKFVCPDVELLFVQECSLSSPWYIFFSPEFCYAMLFNFAKWPQWAWKLVAPFSWVWNLWMRLFFSTRVVWYDTDCVAYIKVASQDCVVGKNRTCLTQWFDGQLLSLNAGSVPIWWRFPVLQYWVMSQHFEPPGQD